MYRTEIKMYFLSYYTTSCCIYVAKLTSWAFPLPDMFMWKKNELNIYYTVEHAQY